MLAVWNPKEPGYYLEMEKGQSGFYDYYFENNSEQSVEIGLQKSSCDCSKVYGCVADPYQAKQYLTKLQEIFAWRNPPNPKSQKDFHWIPLEQNLVEGFEVPPGRSGMIRLTWTGRRSPGEPLRLKLTLWVQEKGNQKTRANVVLQALVRMASPIQFLSRKVRVGAVVPNNPVTKELFCWSSTRDDFDIRVTNTNPCLEIKTERISLKNPGLLAELDALKVKTQVLAARKVTVTIVDSKDGKLLDMGPLRMPLPVEFRVDEIPLDVAVPYLVGTVRSDIEIGNSRNPYQIDLGFFPSKDGIKKKFVLYTDKEVKLNHVENKPVILQVNKLEEKGIEGSKMKWILHLTVPEKRHVGSFSSGSGIVFQSIRPNGKIRRILVPITGTATQELKSKVGF